ncbi:hypothetical protein DUNSADRAFT_1978 [Dunaliella salina]|uniref:Encoded protein n=1 Tax=Dunaliella salina TaxID=3046 RepID=A0ABQ7FWQ5_DUNSA|nr:hypothetical protein DUNSADRAFT_1978 [Dunaliella salina]|eukprot:KAF5826806.1 hypothetical protein DUNSADRAFT_1978 [Dunaliella salina]
MFSGGPPTNALLQQLRGASSAHCAQHTSVSDIAGSRPCLVRDTLMKRISKQDLTTPMSRLRLEDMLAAMPDWTNLPISSATPLAKPTVEVRTFLS